MSSLEILDTGAPLRANGSSVGMLLKHNGTGVLVECGPSVPGKLRKRGIDPLSITDMFISHIHIDHYGGVSELFEMMIGEARARDKNHTLRLWGSQYTVDEVAGIVPGMGPRRRKRKRRMKPLMLQTKPQDERFKIIKVCHSRGSSGLLCSLNGRRILYLGDTGINTDYRGIVDSLSSPTTVVLEANNGFGPSSLKHLGYEHARSIFDSFENKSGEEINKIIWHVRHDREEVRRQAKEDGIIFAEEPRRR